MGHEFRDCLDELSAGPLELSHLLAWASFVKLNVPSIQVAAEYCARRADFGGEEIIGEIDYRTTIAGQMNRYQNTVIPSRLAVITCRDLISITLVPVEFGITPEGSALATIGNRRRPSNAVIVNIEADDVGFRIIVVDEIEVTLLLRVVL